MGYTACVEWWAGWHYEEVVAAKGVSLSLSSRGGLDKLYANTEIGFVLRRL